MKRESRKIVPALNWNDGSVMQEEKKKNELLSLENIQLVDAGLPDFASKVPEAEQAEDDEAEDNYYESLTNFGVFSRAHGMVNIKNCLHDALYAKRYQDEAGRLYIQFCQQYKDGRYSPVMQLSQADFMIAARCGFLDSEAGGAVRKRVAKFCMDAADTYYSMFQGDDDDELDISDVLNVLCHVRKKLPLYKEEAKEMEALELYKAIEEHVADCESVVYKMYEHSSYYKLDEEGIIQLAQILKMKRLELLKLMKRYGFLYLTDSSRGYQSNVRFTEKDGKTFTAWVYCVYKFSFLTGIQKPEKRIEEIAKF